MLLAHLGRDADQSSAVASTPIVTHQIESSFTSREKHKQIVENQFAAIGRTLSMLEASYIRAGIPWLPPTRRAAQFRRKTLEPIEELLRIELVNVQTSALESYCEDLSSLPPTPASAAQLHLTSYPWPEQFSFAAATAVVSGLIGAACIAPFSYHLGVSAFSAWLCMAGGFVVGAMSCSEGYRRASFQALISMELNRRRGGTQTPTTFTPVGVEPLTD